LGQVKEEKKPLFPVALLTLIFGANPKLF